MSYKKLIGLSAAAVMLSAPAFADNHPELVIENFVGTVKVTTAGSSVEITSQDNMSDVDVNTRGDSLNIDGGIRKPDGKKCKGYYSVWNINNRSGRSGGYEDLDDYPILEIDAPADTVLVIRNAIPFLDAEDLGGADLEVDHCGKVNMGDISGPVTVSLNGSGDVTGGNAGDVDVDLRGSGDVAFDDVGTADINLLGSGDVELGSTYAMSVSLRGSGDVEADNVNGDFEAELKGSGDIEIGEVTGNASADLSGSGDIVIDEVTGGTLKLHTRGSGDIDVRGGDVDTLIVGSSGSSNVYFRGTAKDARLNASGSSDIMVDRVTGTVDQSDSGSADIKVRNRS